ncbi:DUF1348-domain-containing protein [Microstroma glucosiphilum]|uniref:DUF1348-domain-containing protein n=1 Tax=Pseudomicrostroma glucosiphilum TaxID=1684307 RepID=A0A316U385_9BASI|nr:DUF1348-domain-containing protein [Pseudomicrostroma glucosiphilum]PWN19776.1 DUF1348-domain-containing protein [Pseudomicrostroma glucosiphilum]
MPPPCPPFTEETARQKVKTAQHAWNGQDPDKVVLAYTEDTIWRNRDEFLHGREEIREFLKRKWSKETHYRLRKELFAFTSNKIAVQFWYEYWNDSLSTWRRCYGLEDWTFADDGRMRKRMMSGNEISIQEGERWFTGAGEEEWDRVEISERHW